MPGRVYVTAERVPAARFYTCEACDREMQKGDVQVITRKFRYRFCRSCVNDMQTAVDELFRSEDKAPKEVKPC